MKKKTMADHVLNFDAKTVPLRGTNLIEASAGTGKTYSIAILVLRILLEMDIQQTTAHGEDIIRNISIKEILMVTFTKAAVAELEERVRRFIRKAYAVAQGGHTDDPAIKSLVTEAIEKKGPLAVYNRLHEAVTFLDESSVQTIHSFCQQVLREFAFETRQSFSVELVTDMSQVVGSELNQFWRSQIAVMPVDILQLLAGMLTREKLKKVISEFFAGKPIYDYDPDRDYPLNEAFFESCRSGVARLGEAIKDVKVQMLELCQDRQGLEAACNKDHHAKKSLLPFVAQPEAFLDAFMLKYKSAKTPAYLEKHFRDLFERAAQIAAYEAEIKLSLFAVLHHIYAAAISFVGPAITAYKEKNGRLCFDDLIEQLHTRLCKEDNPALINAIQSKYKVVFIDEFQDTDRQQYEIFNAAFGTNTVVFYIGDPKQSIYAWRKADIDTYLQAGEQVDHKYGMHINYRSSDDFIRAMNTFFKPTADFDTFYYKNSALGIRYHHVEPPPDNKKGKLLNNAEAFPVISITEARNADEIVEALTVQVADLLSGRYTIAQTGSEPRGVRPTDIGILVRRNSDAGPLKKHLSKLGIPSIVIGDAKILESVEAKEILYVLEAMIAQTRNAINKALLSSITGMTMEQVLAQNDVVTIERFGNYKVQWEKDGVYKALFSFIADYKIESYLTDPATRGGERVIANLYQLIELLYKQQSNKNLSPLELTDWLGRGIVDSRAEGDEYEQRIESDDQCVTIMTVHKSKGLQFNIVLTSAMDLVALSGKEQFLVFKNEKGEDEVLPKELLLGEELEAFEQQRIQENRRMIYVTLTRAVYGCFIYTSTGPQRTRFAIYDFLAAFKTGAVEGIRFIGPAAVPQGFRYKKEKNEQAVRDLPAREPVHFELQHKDWRRLSYTYLAAAPISHGRYEVHPVENAYDLFVFRELTRGNITGNLLHDIFEHIYFEAPAYCPPAVSKAVGRFAPHKRELYEPMLLESIQHVSGAIIQAGGASFALKDTLLEKRLHEFEFDFPVARFARKDLIQLLSESVYLQTIAVEGWEGMMNGKMDMLFEYGAKYYVVDWKSTYLGDSLEDYRPERLALEMSSRNYHLQYLIYTVATVKYLKDRLGDFDYDRDFGGVLYYFVRGVRSGRRSGIYFVKPDRSVIEGLLTLWSAETKSSPL
ncbi:UvrD-helicase domain-containing protein [Arachidicoccus terrestris]|uniref:UvrD-helicase domain-containing protein n=1 Tax=Arachidicoccus terrestris TaxID=2875539 RepID=UPI001CC81DC4|nr:UvrD-helicase domain-containing protein [Arachidicoccus terrestris]UAY55930.1 UvrD-helicase domain-containing protein [Arachidicoccus terrestris]